MKDRLIQNFIMFLTGGIVYFYFEIFVRGFSHISMFILGGICFLLVGGIGNTILTSGKYIILSLLEIIVISGIIITLLELITGYIVNINMRLEVWDYSNMSFNFNGQICMLYSLIWSLMGLPCVYFHGVISRYILNTKNELELSKKNSQAI